MIYRVGVGDGRRFRRYVGSKETSQFALGGAVMVRIEDLQAELDSLRFELQQELPSRMYVALTDEDFWQTVGYHLEDGFHESNDIWTCSE